jgi:hypothetical protein
VNFFGWREFERGIDISPFLLFLETIYKTKNILKERKKICTHILEKSIFLSLMIYYSSASAFSW